MHMGTALGIGSPFGQFAQPGALPYGGSPIASPFQLQTSPYLQSFQQIPGAQFGQPFGIQSQGFGQPAQQLLQILPQQLGQLHQLLQHQVQGLQHLVQVVPQQLQHIQQLLQILPQQIHQLQMQSQQQPFGTQVTPGFGGISPWQQSGVGSPAFGGQAGLVM
jgi:hypothetical protein